MDRYLLATWTRVDDDPGAAEFAELARRAGELARFGPVATYRLLAGGATVDRLRDHLDRLPMDPDLEDVQALVLLRLDDVDAALGEDGARAAVAAALDDTPGPTYQALYLEAGEVAGPAPLPDDFAPAMRLGTFSLKEVDDDWRLAEWYAWVRMPAVAAMPGAHRACRLYTICGRTRFGVHYEFASSEAREQQFEDAEERHALDPDHVTGVTVARTLHAPMSPSIGERVDP